MTCPKCIARWLVDSLNQQRSLNHKFLEQYEAIHGKDAADVLRAHANKLKSQRN